MLSEQEALAALKKYVPTAIPERIIVFNGLYLILAPRKDDPLEGNFDPFWSVDMTTGDVSDYSLFQDGKSREIGELFMKAPML